MGINKKSDLAVISGPFDLVESRQWNVHVVADAIEIQKHPFRRVLTELAFQVADHQNDSSLRG